MRASQGRLVVDFLSLSAGFRLCEIVPGGAAWDSFDFRDEAPHMVLTATALYLSCLIEARESSAEQRAGLSLQSPFPDSPCHAGRPVESNARVAAMVHGRGRAAHRTCLERNPLDPILRLRPLGAPPKGARRRRLRNPHPNPSPGHPAC